MSPLFMNLDLNGWKTQVPSVQGQAEPCFLVRKAWFPLPSEDSVPGTEDTTAVSSCDCSKGTRWMCLNLCAENLARLISLFSVCLKPSSALRKLCQKDVS